MSADDGTGSEVGAGTGDRVTAGNGSVVTGVVTFDTGGAVVQPEIITNTTSARETLKVLMNSVDAGILKHPVV